MDHLSTSRLETVKHSNKICIGTFVNKNLLNSWPITFHKNSPKINIKENHYSEPLCPQLKVMSYFDEILSKFPFRNLFPCYVLLYGSRSSSIQRTFIDPIYHCLYHRGSKRYAKRNNSCPLCHLLKTPYCFILLSCWSSYGKNFDPENIIFIIKKTQLGIRTSNAVNGLVYEKSLRFSLLRSAEHSQGSLVNHIQVDSDKLYNLGLAMGGTMILPLLIGVGIYFMWAAVGISFLAGIGVLIIMGAVNFCVGKSYFK